MNMLSFKIQLHGTESVAAKTHLKAAQLGCLLLDFAMQPARQLRLNCIQAQCDSIAEL